jgi:hypothetical protein
MIMMTMLPFRCVHLPSLALADTVNDPASNMSSTRLLEAQLDGTLILYSRFSEQ